MVPEVYTHWVRPDEVLERVDTSTQTEQSGYVSTDKQIAAMVLAGERLDQYRKEAYDFSAEEEVPPDVEFKTRTPGYDPADAAQDLMAVAARLAATSARKPAVLESAAPADEVKEAAK